MHILPISQRLLTKRQQRERDASLAFSQRRATTSMLQLIYVGFDFDLIYTHRLRPTDDTR
jgi:hypothetical protein